MQKLLVATNNDGKMKEIRSIFSNIYEEVLSLREAGIDLNVDEDGTTYEANAIRKACEAAKWAGMDALADDSGLEVYAMNHEPGVFSARYLGEDTPQSEKNETIIKRLENISPEKRGARFVCCMALARPGKPTLTAYGFCEGMIADAQKGESGFGYDPIFYLPEHGATFAQMEPELKNKLSHRYKALCNLKEMLLQEKP